MFRTGNPALNNSAFQPSQSWGDLASQGRYAGDAPGAAKAVDKTVMSLQGTVNKTTMSISICTAGALGSWVAIENNPGLMMPLLFGGMLTGLVFALITIFKPTASPITAPLYAVAQGGFVGGISMMYAQMFADGETLNTGLVFNAALLTFGIAGGLAAAYGMRLVRPNKTFYNIVTTATLGLLLYVGVALIAGLFGSFSLLSVYDPTNGGLISIGFSGLVVALASANLVLDYDIVNNGVKNRAPKYMEWYGAFTILVTLVWLYISLLRLLAKLQSRN